MDRNTLRLPGELLLSLARRLFPPDTVSALFAPAVADLQHEWQQTEPRTWGRRITLLRGYLAVARLLFVAPFRTSRPGVSLPAGHLRLVDPPDRGTLVAGVVMWVLLLGSMWSLVGSFVLVIAAGTIVTAAGIHLWQCRQTGRVGSRAEALPNRPEINFAAIPVNGNMAGLLVVIGSLAVIAAGLPALGLFLLIAALSGAVLATALRVWHLAHPASCPNSILAR